MQKITDFDFILFKEYLKLGLYRPEFFTLSSFLLNIREIKYLKKYSDPIFYDYLKIDCSDLEYLDNIYGYVIYQNIDGNTFFVDISLNKFNYRFCDRKEMLKLIEVRKQNV